MDIWICDDDIQFRKLLKKNIENFLREKGVEASITTFSNGEELLEAGIVHVDVLFLDVDLVTTNGMDVAKALRARLPDFLLVFVSGLLEYAPSGFTVDAFRYLLKDQISTLLPPCLEDVLRRLGVGRSPVSFGFVAGTSSLFTDQIVYVHSEAHQLTFHIVRSALPQRTMWCRLDEVEAMLPESEFARIHKSYLVNLYYVSGIKDRNILLVDGQALPISHARMKEAKEKYYRYKGLI